jgi:hypothetical protein
MNYSFGGGAILDVDKMLAELRLEREQIEEAILTLERLARGRGRRRGRPPGWLKDAAASLGAEDDDALHAVASEPKRRGRPPGSSKMKPAVHAHAAEASA